MWFRSARWATLLAVLTGLWTGCSGLNSDEIGTSQCEIVSQSSLAWSDGALGHADIGAFVDTFAKTYDSATVALSDAVITIERGDGSPEEVTYSGCPDVVTVPLRVRFTQGDASEQTEATATLGGMNGSGIRLRATIEDYAPWESFAALPTVKGTIQHALLTLDEANGKLAQGRMLVSVEHTSGKGADGSVSNAQPIWFSFDLTGCAPTETVDWDDVHAGVSRVLEATLGTHSSATIDGKKGADVTIERGNAQPTQSRSEAEICESKATLPLLLTLQKGEGHWQQAIAVEQDGDVATGSVEITDPSSLKPIKDPDTVLKRENQVIEHARLSLTLHANGSAEGKVQAMVKTVMDSPNEGGGAYPEVLFTFFVPAAE